jgi:DNA-binding beta-propeller fold protein YncE
LQWIARSSPANCGSWGRGAIVPLNTVTNTPGKPIRISHTGPVTTIVMTPDGKTVYVAAMNEIVPVSTATNQPGRPIRVPYGMPGGAVITP